MFNKLFAILVFAVVIAPPAAAQQLPNGDPSGFVQHNTKFPLASRSIEGSSSTEAIDKSESQKIEEIQLPTKLLSGFQQFVLDTTGRIFPFFGENALQKTIRLDNSNLPVSADYEIGAGDELLVRVWGAIDVNVKAKVDRDGQLTIPSVGTFPVAGIKARDLDSFLTSQVGQYYKNFNLSATLGKLGGVNIYVAGHALAPGMHMVNSTSTLASVVLSVAQPGSNGSFRNVQLRRGGQTVATFDLYNLLADGNLIGDRKLQAGDVVFVGQAGKRIALNIEGPAAAIFELKQGETLADVLATVGVDTTLLRHETVLIEGFNTAAPQTPRNVEKLSYNRALREAQLRDGDIVTILQTRREFANAVTLKGAVADPARYPYFSGMTIADLIPNTDVLIQPDYFKKKSALVGYDKKIEDIEDSIKNSLPQLNWDYAVIERLNRSELKPLLMPFNLRKAMARDPLHNLALQPGDVLTIFSVEQADIPKSKKSLFIKVAGEVGAPGYYQVAPGETLRDVLVKAGGLTRDAYLFGTKLIRTAIVKQQQEQYSKALEQAERLLQAASSSSAASALNSSEAASVQAEANAQRQYLEKLRATKPDGRLVLDVESKAKSIAELPPLVLEDGDSIAVPSMPGQVAILGSVYSQGAFAYQRGQSVFDYLSRAGGASKTSDKSSIFVLRANGTVDSAQQGWLPFVNGLYGKDALPGDTIYVPEDFQRVSFMKGLLDISQVFFQLGLGAAAIKAIQD